MKRNPKITKTKKRKTADRTITNSKTALTVNQKKRSKVCCSSSVELDEKYCLDDTKKIQEASMVFLHHSQYHTQKRRITLQILLQVVNIEDEVLTVTCTCDIISSS
jgi:hypothetical protein